MLIIDELGRGTSTSDGFGLAYGISKYIITKIGATALFATHFHELCTLEEELSQVLNVHTDVMIQDKTLVLLHKILEGSCDKSFGIHIAEMCGFPEMVLKVATEKAKELAGFLNSDYDSQQFEEEHGIQILTAKQNLETIMTMVKHLDLKSKNLRASLLEIQKIIQQNSSNPFLKKWI